MGAPPGKKPPTSKSKAEKTDLFTIRPDPKRPSSVPGVTDLLSREEIAKKKVQIKSLEPTRNTSTFDYKAAERQKDRTGLVVPSELSLSKLGVYFELRFTAEGSVFRFSSSRGHLEADLVPWQQNHFQNMKLDPRLVPMHDPFQEFSYQSDPFVFEAFAVNPKHWIQVIVPEFSNSRIVLVSQKSLALYRTDLIDHFSKG